ncbi:hypothetical protein B484DRAFT_412784 [Ochromonadaceae sp. CCMP2298]|nr:hypothetical protein B484DRAFT_412784 [Ochromonadaceae sp. CCMP2298]
MALCVSLVGASCPNHCNSNGVCDKYGRCTCDVGFQGADCSEKICPFSLAWSDQASAIDVAHAEAECSNRGLCNRHSGKCACMSGFSGSACERLDCASQCSHKGVCYSMRDFAARTRNDQSERYTYTTQWDADKIKGCQCDYPAAGYDCSQQLCASGDDPLTTGQKNEVQLLLCSASTGSFVLYYNGHPSHSISHAANAAAVKTALLAIPQLTGAKVVFSQAHGSVCQLHANVVSVEFTEQFGAQFPLVPYLDDTLTDSGGSVTISADGLATLTDVSGTQIKSVKGTKENEICSSRGQCDRAEGMCACYDTNGDMYGSSDGYGAAGARGDCGYIQSSTSTEGVSTCPGAVQCSGHGVCDTSSFRCSCSTGWGGGDCSQMQCPEGKTWFAYPSEDESAHMEYDTCSNMGTCNYRTGKCQCREGFYGEACQYMACGGGKTACHGHGRCQTMAELALWAQSNGDATEYQYGSDPNEVATWDYDRVHGCLCDSGFSGYDCSLVDCPAGDDPGTYEDHSEVQLLQCIADQGNFTLSFRQAVTIPLSSNVTAEELQEALNALPTLTNVAVYFIYDGLPPNGTLNDLKPDLTKADGFPAWGRIIGEGASRSFQYVPTVYAATNYMNSSFCMTDGSQVAVLHFQYTHGDLPALIAQTVDLGDAVNHNAEPHSGKIHVYDDGEELYGLQSILGTTETDVCNKRGLCDTSSGLCHCFDTWTSSDGMRQGGAGSTRDCGYRNDYLFSSVHSGRESV